MALGKGWLMVLGAAFAEEEWATYSVFGATAVSILPFALPLAAGLILLRNAFAPRESRAPSRSPSSSPRQWSCSPLKYRGGSDSPNCSLTQPQPNVLDPTLEAAPIGANRCSTRVGKLVAEYAVQDGQQS